MKKIIVCMLLAFAFTRGYSQTQKGNMLVGGQFNVSGNSNVDNELTFRTTTKQIGFSIAPNVGYFVKDNLAMGLRGSFGLNSNNGTSAYKSTNDYYSNKTMTPSYGIRGFVRHYTKLSERLSFIVDGSAGYSYSDDKGTYLSTIGNVSETGVSHTFSNVVGASVIPGLVYFVKPNLGLQLTYSGLFYNYSTSKISGTDQNGTIQDGRTYSSNFAFNTSITSLYLGLNYHF